MTAKKRAKTQVQISKSLNKPYILRFIDVLCYQDYLSKDGNSTCDEDYLMEFKTIGDAKARAEKGRYCGLEYYEVLKVIGEYEYKCVYTGY